MTIPPPRSLASLAGLKRLISQLKGSSNLRIDNLQMFCSPNLFHYSQKHAVTLATTTLHFISKLQSFFFSKNKPHKPTDTHVIFDISSSRFRKHKNKHKCNESNSLFSKVYLSFPFMNRFSL